MYEAHAFLVGSTTLVVVQFTPILRRPIAILYMYIQCTFSSTFYGPLGAKKSKCLQC